MPAIRHFVVKEEREVQVSANSAHEAVLIAAAAFQNGQNSGNGVIDGPPDVWGNTTSKIKTTHISATEE